MRLFFSDISLNGYYKGSDLFKSLEFLNCFELPLRVTEASEVLTVEDLIKRVLRCSVLGRGSDFSFILRFRNGQFQFYITKLSLDCDDHARLFTESTTTVPSNASRLCSEQSCLQFLSSLEYCNLSSHSVKGLGAVIGNCKHLRRIKVASGDDSICYLLEKVRNPSKCSLYICGFYSHAWLTSVGAVQLANLLPRFNNVIVLKLYLSDCCAAALDTLVTSITHKTLEKLTLYGIILTPAATKELGRSLPEMSSLEELVLCGVDGSILQSKQMEALFGRFNKTLPWLEQLIFSGFNVSGGLAPLIKSLCFFPSLRKLRLEKLNIDGHDQCSVLKSFRSLTRLEVGINGEGSQDSFHLNYQYVELGVISLTPAVAAMLGRLLPELSHLEELKLTGLRGSILQAEEMEALFGGFNKTVSLYSLTFTDFSVGGCLFPLFKSFRFFPNLHWLHLNRMNLDELDLRGLQKSVQFIPNLQELDLSGNPLGHAVTSLLPHVINLKNLRFLYIDNTGSSEEDLNYVRDTVQ